MRTFDAFAVASTLTPDEVSVIRDLRRSRPYVLDYERGAGLVAKELVESFGPPRGATWYKLTENGRAVLDALDVLPIEGETPSEILARGERRIAERRESVRLALARAEARLALVDDALGLARMIDDLSSSPLCSDYVAPQVQNAARALLERASKENR